MYWWPLMNTSVSVSASTVTVTLRSELCNILRSRSRSRINHYYEITRDQCLVCLHPASASYNLLQLQKDCTSPRVPVCTSVSCKHTHTHTLQVFPDLASFFIPEFWLELLSGPCWSRTSNVRTHTRRDATCESEYWGREGMLKVTITDYLFKYSKT